ncbi:MAG: PstS family phosphate ABC transporter substrate-binding protein [Chloroflexi bacterium]|nr:PstS family phosphate ABC transporter substrate-binding protein [Chloroflexota bacterium]
MTDSSSSFTRIRRWAAVGAIVATAAFAVACSDDEEPATPASPSSPSTSAPTASPTAATMDGIDYGALSGTVRVDGSSTVYPVGEAVAEEFSKISSARVNVAFSGTGGGFEKFCRGETQFSHASRPIKESEVAACAANGIDDIVELQVAIDALTVMVHPDNDWVLCLNVQQMHDLFRVDGYTNWNQVDPSFPDRPISFFVPGTDSGTFDYFVEAIIDGVADDVGHRGDVTASEDDNILIRGLESDVNSIGYFGFAYFLHAGDRLKAVAIDGGEGCVEPAFEAALDGSYVPLARPLFIYTTETLMEENEAALGFAKFYMDNIQTLVPEVGYVTLPDDLFQSQLAKLEPFLP